GDGGWLIDEVEPLAQVGNAQYDLRITSAGTLHVAYQLTNVASDAGSSDAGFFGVRHAQRASGASSWTYGVVETSAGPVLGSALGLAVDSAGEPAVAYLQTVDADGGRGLKVARRVGGASGTWASENVGDVITATTANLPSNATSLDFGPGNELSVALSTRDPSYRLSTYVKPVGGAWQVGETMISTVPGQFPTLRYSPAGHPWLTYYSTDSAVIRRLTPSAPLVKAVHQGLSLGDFYAGRYISMAFDAAGRAHFIYNTSNPSLTRTLYYARLE
ncbi:MAG: hypothetical protein JNG84_14675, partial [Archangium sp.]|nr:hypothetical protein [Archangium sp.]